MVLSQLIARKIIYAGVGLRWSKYVYVCLMFRFIDAL